MLTDAQKKRLRSLSHALKPVVMIGQHGMKDTINEAMEEALNVHELIKVKVAVGDRDARDELIKKLINTHKAELIQRVGNIALMYRANPEKPKISSEL